MAQDLGRAYLGEAAFQLSSDKCRARRRRRRAHRAHSQLLFLSGSRRRDGRRSWGQRVGLAAPTKPTSRDAVQDCRIGDPSMGMTLSDLTREL